jgi:hypothetical protein
MRRLQWSGSCRRRLRTRTRKPDPGRAPRRHTSSGLCEAPDLAPMVVSSSRGAAPKPAIRPPLERSSAMLAPFRGSIGSLSTAVLPFVWVTLHTIGPSGCKRVSRPSVRSWPGARRSARADSIDAAGWVASLMPGDGAHRTRRTLKARMRSACMRAPNSTT